MAQGLCDIDHGTPSRRISVPELMASIRFVPPVQAAGGHSIGQSTPELGQIPCPIEQVQRYRTG